jgi:catechol 2,3-dioxygenase-like lactoylglutathione lyase family enzyme
MPRPTLPFVANNAFFYYNNLERAAQFYAQTLGFRRVADYGKACTFQIAASSFLTLVDITMSSMHSPDEPKSVTLSCVVDDVEGWYRYLSGQRVPIHRELTVQPGQPRDGFVALDPEGYFLEFERFNDHPENAALLPRLRGLAPIPPDPAGNRPAYLGITTTVLWLYYRDIAAGQRFFQERLGLQPVVEHTFFSLYPVSASGLVGAVVAGRGLHPYTEQKAVTISLLTGSHQEIEAWFAWMQECASRQTGVRLRSEAISTRNPRYEAFVIYSPEDYTVEFNLFLAHPDNQEFLAVLAPHRQG